MERKIGEIFEHNGEWYQCLKSLDENCTHCDMDFGRKCPNIKECTGTYRIDKQNVIFKELEKVGEPIPHHCPSGRIIYFQKYKLFDKSYSHNTKYIMCDINEDGFISIELKQNPKDMEEKKLNLKPFDLQKAKEGKPVCTRDGRKARIICFDRNDLYPIVVLIECEDGKEMVGAYSNEGQTKIYELEGTDLMMLPEKKEGWVNVYKDSVYDTKDEALIGRSECRGYIDTIKINWSE